MANTVFTGTYHTTVAGDVTFNVKVSYSESYNASTNKTTVSITGVELQMVGNSINWGSLPVFGSIAVNGTTLLSMNGGSAVRVSLSGSGYCGVSIPASGSVAITHNDDGTKSVSFDLGGSLYHEGYYYFGALYNGEPFGLWQMSKTVALTTRPRASSIASCPATAKTQQTISLTVTRNSTSFYHKATFKVGNTDLYTSDAFATALNYQIPRSWFNNYPSSSLLDMTVSVQTYTNQSCTTAIGSPATAPLTVTADDGMKPTVNSGWVSFSAYNTDTAASGISGYVKGYSKAQATFKANKIGLANNATIASYSITCQGTTVNASPYLTPTLTSTSVSVKCTVTDSRGRSASETKTLSVMDYAKPKLSGISVYRCDANQNADDEGTYISVKATLSFSPLPDQNNVDQNNCSLKAAFASTGGSYGTATDLTSGTAARLGPVSTETSYTVRIRATDALGNTATYYAAVPTRKWAMKFRANGRGVAFGKAAETNDCFEVSPDWTVKFGQPLGLESGGTGAATAAAARTNLDVTPTGQSFVRLGTYAATDPDTQNSNGFQHVSIAAGKSPTGSSFYGELLTFVGNGTARYQILMSTSAFWFRGRGTGTETWSAWHQLTIN